ncbi:MAG: hypothetical protein ACFFDF_05810 [Candidatus Odinarchaeota archaeon]
MIEILRQPFLTKVIKKIKDHQKVEFEKFSYWIPAGSGNFEKTKQDGRYRENCNTYRDTITCEDHRIESIKLIFNHCNKLDCKTCFIHASSDRARTINERILEFRSEARKHGIKTGNILHIVFSPKKNVALENMKDYNDFLEYRSNKIFTMLKDCGIFAGILFTQLWSYKCKNCSKNENGCICQEKKLERKLNPHFHVIGYGYLKSNKEFRDQYKDWVYTNLGRRRDGYHTIFYILTNVALWRKSDGKLKPAYQSFGYLKSNYFAQIREKVRIVNDCCPICKKPRKRIVDGVKIYKAPEIVQNSLLLLQKDNNQITLAEKLSIKESNDLFKLYKNEIYLINVSERSIVFGKEMKYTQIVREYELLDVNGLRELIMKNKIQYRKDKNKCGENYKQGNEYG